MEHKEIINSSDEVSVDETFENSQSSLTPQELFNRNKKLVPYVFWKHFSKFQAIQEDLISEGNISLWKACLNFDASKGKFSTYAGSMIWGNMLAYIRCKSTTIRIPRTLYGSDDVQYVCYSLDSVYEDSDGLTLGDMIPVNDALSDDCVADIIDSLCATIKNEKHRAIVEEYLYGLVFFQAPRQIDLAEKYNVGQPAIQRILHKYRTRFQKLL